MDKPRGFTSGLMTALASILLVAGAAFLSLSEGQVKLDPIFVPYPTLPVYDYSFPTSPTTDYENPINTQFAPTSNQIACIAPHGWLPYRVLPDDTLETLAQIFPASSQEIVAANCLLGDVLPVSSIIYLPPGSATSTLVPTQAPILCGPPAGWIRYLIQPLDNLFRLSLAFGVSIPELQLANCLGNSTTIFTGEYLMVPNVPTRTPIGTQILLITVTPTSFITLVEPSPTVTFTATPTEISSPTFTPTPTVTVTNTMTESLTATPTPTTSPTTTSTASE